MISCCSLSLEQETKEKHSENMIKNQSSFKCLRIRFSPYENNSNGILKNYNILKLHSQATYGLHLLTIGCFLLMTTTHNNI
jgi:hypothetical protein